MQIKIGHMDKRINSTKYKCEWTTPDGYVDVKLKEPTTIDKPVFILLKKHYRVDEQGHSVLVYELDPKSDNWIYVDEWKSYYWVDQVEYTTNDLITLYCHRDVLASSIEMLKNAEAMVKYADEDHWDKYLDDSRFQPDYQLNGCDVVSAGDISSYIKWENVGCVLFTTLTYTGATDTGYVSYILSPEQTIEVLRGMYNSWDEVKQLIDGGGSPTDNFFTIMTNLTYSFGSQNEPDKMIAGIKWFPMTVKTLKEAIEKSYDIAPPGLFTTNVVNFGGIQQAITGDPAPCFELGLGNCIQSDSIWAKDHPDPSVAFNWVSPHEHPGASGFGKRIPWLNGSKYLSVKLVTPSGMQEVNNDDVFIYVSTLQPKWAMGILDGEYTVSFVAVQEQQQGVITPEALVASDSGCAAVDLTHLIHSDIGTLGGNIVRSGLNLGVGALKLGMNLAIAEDIGKTKTNVTSVTTTVEDKKVTRTKEGQIGGIGTTTRATTEHSYVEKGTGIFNSLSMGKSASPQCANINCPGTMYSMYANNVYGNIFSFVSTYALPSLLANDPGGNSGKDQIISPTTQEIYDRYEAFCTIHGWPCSRVLKLEDIETEGTYLETAWLSLGKSDLLLTPAELCELNSFLNSGIYLDDWAEEETEE